MVNLSSNESFPRMERVRQITSYHCGPAVVCMLASYAGGNISQEEVVESAGVISRIEEHGMTVSEMGKAVSKILPDLTFWYKTDATLGELSEIVNRFKYPVGVEWQGVFFEDADEDNGHYSVVTKIDTVRNILMLADPYSRFAGTDRKFSILEFENRWWDENEIEDPVTRKKSVVLDNQMMFIIVPKIEKFPEYLGMIPAY